MVIRSYDCMTIWTYDHMTIGSYDHMITWSYDHMIIWSCDHMIIWSYGRMIIWSYGHMSIWSHDHGHPLQKTGNCGKPLSIHPLHLVGDKRPHPLHRTHPLHLKSGLTNAWKTVSTNSGQKSIEFGKNLKNDVWHTHDTAVTQRWHRLSSSMELK